MDLCGPFGSGGGPFGQFNSPPPSYTANGIFREKRCAELKALPSYEMLLPKFGDTQYLSSPPSDRLMIVQEKPEWPRLRDGVGSARVGDEIPI